MNSYNVKISIIVPIYNSEKYIRKCIQSILSQSFLNFEILAVNDGSSDKSYEILKSIKDERLKIINKKNQGVSIARNYGIEASKGEYLLFVDSDDYIEPNFLQSIYEKSIKNELDILITDYYLVEKDKRKYMKDLDIEEEKIITGEEYLQKFFEKNLMGYNVSKLIKKELFLKNNIRYNTKITIMEDTLLLVELLKKCKKIGKINKAYYNYVQHNYNASKKVNFSYLKNIEEVFRILKIKFYKDKNILELVEIREIYCSWWIFYYLKQEEMNYYIEQIIPKIKKINFKKIKISKMAKIKLYSIKIFGNKKILWFWRKIFI